MQFNNCNYCGAKDGRAGILFTLPSNNVKDACENCKDTIVNKEITVHTRLIRTEEELQKTMDLLK